MHTSETGRNVNGGIVVAVRTFPKTPGAKYVSLAVAAEEFGISVKTLRRRIADGTVHGYLVGRLIRVDLAELRQRMIVEIPAAKRPDR